MGESSSFYPPSPRTLNFPSHIFKPTPHLHDQNVTMHKHISNPQASEHSSLLDSLSDTFINAFSKVRKPDERFLEMREGIDKFEEGLLSIERLSGKESGRTDGEFDAATPPPWARGFRAKAKHWS